MNLVNSEKDFAHFCGGRSGEVERGGAWAAGPTVDKLAASSTAGVFDVLVAAGISIPLAVDWGVKVEKAVL